MEKIEPSASELVYLSNILDKPITYFFQKPIYEELVQKDMDDLSLEMQMQFEQIYGDDLKKLVIKITKVIAKFNPSDLVINLAPEIISRLDNEEKLEKFLDELSKRSIE